MTNPALVLHGHFERLAKVDRTHTTWPDAWEEVVGLRWPVAVAPLLGLIDKTYELLSTRTAFDLNPLMEHEPTWRTAILLPGINPGHTILESGFSVSPSAINSLYALGMVIQGFPEIAKPLRDQQVEQLTAAVDELHKSILESEDIDDDLRVFLLDQTIKMQARLGRRKIEGDGPIRDLVAETVGSSAIESSLWQRAMATSLKTKIVSVFFAYNAIIGGINGTADAVGHIQQAYSVSHQVIEYVLGSGPQAIEAPEPPELSPSQRGRTSNAEAVHQPSADDDVVDAEIVDQSQPDR